MANALSFILEFKANFAGLQRVASEVQTRMATIQASAQKMEEGAAATMNRVVQGAAALFAADKLRAYGQEAIEAAKGQAQLNQALKKSGQDSAAYRAELQAQAQALQNLTGVDDDQITQIQRQLVFGKTQRKDIADLTALTLDFAAAKSIDGVTASKLIVKALQGEGEELKRYGVELGEGTDRLSALKKGLTAFKGQASEAFSALPEDVRSFQIAANDASKSVGALVLEGTGPLMSGFANGLKNLKEKMDGAAGGGSTLVNIVKDITGAIGTLVGGNLDKLLALAAAVLAIKLASSGAAAGLRDIANVFLLLTGGNLMQVLVSLQGMSKEIGLLKALSMGGWVASFAAGIAMIAGALAGLAIGSAVIKGVEAAQLARLDREEKIAKSAWDQVRAIQVQIASIRSLDEAKAAQAEADKKLADTQARIKELEAKTHTETIRSGYGMVGTTSTISNRTPDEEKELQEARSTIPLLQRNTAITRDPKFLSDLIERNISADFKTRFAPKDSDKTTQSENELKRRTMEYDTAIAEAQADHNFQLENILTRERDEWKLSQELLATSRDQGSEYDKSYQTILDRLDAEEAARVKAHDRVVLERELFALESRAQEAEVAGNEKLAENLRDQIKLKQYQQQLEGADPKLATQRVTAERAVETTKRNRQLAELALQKDLSELDQKIAKIEADRYATDEQKQRAMLPLLQQENDKIAARIALIDEELNRLAPDDPRRLDLNQERGNLSDKQSTVGGKITQAQPQTFEDGMLQGASGQGGFLDSLGTSASNAADAVKGTLNSALSQTSNLLYDLATGSASFHDAWSAATLAVGQEFLHMVTDMVAKMIWRATVERALTAIGVATHVAGEEVKTTATLSGSAIRIGTTIKEALASVYHGAVSAFEAMASIPYVGPVLAFAAMAAALAGGIALISKISHADGGIIRGPGGPTDDVVPAMLSNGEGVIRASSVNRFGDGFIKSLNAGVLDLSQLPANVQASIARPTYGGDGTRTGGGAAGSSGASFDQLADRMTIIYAASEREATRISRQSRARGDIVRIVSEDFGIPAKRR